MITNTSRSYEVSPAIRDGITHMDYFCAP